MSSLPENLYACWREQKARFHFLHEGDAAPPEKMLQAIWHHQRLLRERLKTEDGKTIRVLHPGFWNREAGPDFRGAVLKIGDDVKTGDIEIDLVHAGWRGHGHDRNPAFKNVILHIVWSVPSPLEEKRIAKDELHLPLLTLENSLDAPLAELATWLGSDAAQSWPRELNGQCSAPLRDLPGETIKELLHQAALVRLQRKAHEFQFRARQVGWEQSFWEMLFRALGYKQNVWPMQRLGETLPQLPRRKKSALELQACLFGVSGMLSEDLPPGSEAYLRKIWDIWWRERDALAEFVLPRAVWKFNALRPANHPQRRLALATHWLTNEKFINKLEHWFSSEKSDNQPLPALLKILTVHDEFWSQRFTFRSAKMSKPQPLLGERRATDLAINVILPWFWMRAVAGKNAKAQKRAEDFYFSWPAAEDNSVLRLARRRLFGEIKPRRSPTAALQQGLLQIVRDFCEHSNAVCENCRFPDLVRQIK